MNVVGGHWTLDDIRDHTEMFIIWVFLVIERKISAGKERLALFTLLLIISEVDITKVVVPWAVVGRSQPPPPVT